MLRRGQLYIVKAVATPATYLWEPDSVFVVHYSKYPSNAESHSDRKGLRQRRDVMEQKNLCA